MRRVLYFGLFVLALGALPGFAAPTITLTPNLPSPQMVGTPIVWTVSLQNPDAGHTYDYQFIVVLNGNVQIVRDSSPSNTFTWVPSTVEGTYWVVVKVRDTTSPPPVNLPYAGGPYQITPWVTTAGGSAVNSTSNPLVALFSGPPCTAGHFLLVRFRKSGDTVSHTTNSVPCSQSSANFYVAGMLPSTQYVMHWEEYGANFAGSVGADLTFQTGALPANFPALQMTVNVPPTAHDASFPVVLFEMLSSSANPFWPVATDLSGNVIWFYPGPLFLATRIETNGNFFAMNDTTLSEYDLAGHVILQTNMNILNEQLVIHGYPPMTSFNNHETRRLPDGRIIILGARDVVSTTAQGGTPTAPVDILGDMVLVLDHNMQLLWAWDSFAHQDITRAATLGDVCPPNNPGCPLFNPSFTQANDWTHANFAQLTADGNIILSERAQDWVIKINYANGAGDGHVMWRLGPYGDFQILNPPSVTCGDPNVFPWFTHQHDAALIESDATTTGFKVMTVFDDGNLRHMQCGNTGNSRGMVLFMDEANLKIYIQTAADLGAYSGAVGSSQLLFTGSSQDAGFGNGLIGFPNTTAQATEVDLSGNIVYQLQANAGSYRTYRLQDLYTPTNP